MTPVAHARIDRPHPRRAEPIFRSLFQAGERTAADFARGAGIVGQRDLSLTSVASASSTAAVSGQTPEVRAPGRLDLFSDRNGTFSG